MPSELFLQRGKLTEIDPEVFLVRCMTHSQLTMLERCVRVGGFQKVR